MIAALDAALAYAISGTRVFPCNWPILHNGGAVTCSCRSLDCGSIGKHPKTRSGFYNASVDPQQIRDWWTRWPHANIGLPTGLDNDLFVLDVDPEHGGDASLHTLEEKHGPLPLTRRAITGSGGAHILFRHIDGLGNSVGALGAGLDTRSAGGYIIVPPSRHKTGRRYEWMNNAAIVAAPDWLVRLVIGERTNAVPGGENANAVPGRRQSGYWCRIARGVRQGERHVMILKLSGLLLGVQRIEPILALALVRGFNARCCDPPLPEEEVDERFGRVMNRQMRNEH